MIEETSYTYGNTQWGDLLTNYNGTAISYDISGNPLNWRNAAILNWQGRRLNSMALDSGYIHGLDFKYNADGIRTQKSYFDHSTANMYSVSYTLDGTKILAQTYKHSTTGETYTVKFFYDDNDAPIAMEYGGNYYYYRTNIQGDIEGIYNSNGTLVVSYSYDAWGNILSTTGTLASTVGEINPFRYRGYYYDTETGWYYLQSRYYDPTVGRFLNADSVVTFQLLLTSRPQCNLYSYCWNNYVNWVDNDGVWPTANYTKTKNFISLEIVVPWKDIEIYFKARSYVTAVIGIIACFIPDATVSKVIGVAAGIDSIVSSIISEVIAEKKSGKSIRIGISFNYKITENSKYVYIVNTRWFKLGFWYKTKTAKISNIRWWVRL